MLLGTVPTLLAGDIPEHQIMRSVRLNAADTAYFSRTPTTPTSRRKFTVSVWAKRCALSSTVASTIFSSGTSNVDDTGIIFSSAGPGRIDFYDRAASTIRGYVSTTAIYPDTSAWCHVVGIMDSDSATPTDRMQVWVNGVRQSITTNNQLPINTDTMITGEFRIGRNASASAASDLMLTEFYFIDGQALQPTAFAKFDAITGAWIPKVYTGTYGANGVYLKFADNSAATAVALGKDSSGMSNLFPYSDDFTNAAWAKGNSAVLTAGQTDPFGGAGAYKLAVSAATMYPYVYSALSGSLAGAVRTTTIYAKAGELTLLQIQCANTQGAVGNFNLVSGTIDSTGAIGTGTVVGASISSVGGGWHKCSITALIGAGTPGDQVSLFLPVTPTAINGQGIYIYRANATVGSVVPAELQYTSGAAVADKNYTPNNINVTAGVGNDSLVDVPTNYGTDTGVGGEVRGNYATLDTLPMWGIGAKCTYTNGQLEVSNTGAYQMISTFGMTTGKWYCEMLVQTAVDSAYPMAGVWAGLTAPIAAYYPGYTAGSGVSYATSGNKYYEGTNAAYGAAFTTGDTIGIAVDAGTGKVWFRKNGTWQASGDPVAGTNPALTLVGGLYFIGGAGYYGNPAFNFGQRPYRDAAPTGYKALCTQNLPVPAVKKPSDYFGATVYDGNDAFGRNITAGLGFQGDFWISKGRNLLQNNAVIDSARPDLWLATNTISPEQPTGNVARFITNGIQVGPVNANAPYDMWNDTGNSYVGAVWKKGALPGVDVVTYTGNGVARTIPHTLGKTPSMMIVKNLDGGSYNWIVYYHSLGAGSYLVLNTNGAPAADTSVWNNTAPTGASFTLGTNAAVNANGVRYIAYVFAEVPGFSRFGSYVGNGAADGPMVWCGLSPRWILRKRIDTVGGWWMQDAARSPINTNNIVSALNVADAELATTYHADFLANGIKIRNTSNNQSGGTYLIAAFAISPFKTARIFAEPNHSGPPIVPPQNTTNFLVQAPTSVVTHQPFLFSVTARNAGGGTETGYNGTVHFTYTGQPLVLPADSTLTNGVGTFSATRNEGTGSIIVATDTVNGSITGQSGFIGYGGGG